MAVLSWQMGLWGNVQFRSVSPFGAGNNEGQRLFGVMNIFLVAGLWLLAPILSADCLSQEKREGTFNLLFLTPLKPLDIVLGKAFVHAWRALTFLAAAFPVLAVTLLVGGVGWMDMLRMAMTQAAVLTLALTAGLLASALCQSWIKARLMALLISVGSGFAFILVHTTIHALFQYVSMSKATLQDWTFTNLWLWRWDSWVNRLSFSGYGYSTFWSEGAGANTSIQQVVLMAGILLISLLLVTAMVYAATQHVRRVWRSPPVSPRLKAAVETLTRARFAPAWQKRRKGRVMDSNPAWWLEMGRWEQRIIWAIWLAIWMALVPMLNFSTLGTSLGLEEGLLTLSPFILLAAVASAVSSFRRERAEGGFELLLVTPLSPRRMILARFSALILQVLPIFVVWSATLLLVDYRGLGSGASFIRWGQILVILIWAAVGGAFGLFLACTRLPYALAALIATVLPLLLGYLLTITIFREMASLIHERFHMDGFGNLFSLILSLDCVMGVVLLFASLSLAELALARRWFLPRPSRKGLAISPGSH